MPCGGSWAKRFHSGLTLVFGAYHDDSGCHEDDEPKLCAGKEAVALLDSIIGPGRVKSARKAFSALMHAAGAMTKDAAKQMQFKPLELVRERNKLKKGEVDSDDEGDLDLEVSMLDVYKTMQKNTPCNKEFWCFPSMVSDSNTGAFANKFDPDDLQRVSAKYLRNTLLRAELLKVTPLDNSKSSLSNANSSSGGANDAGFYADENENIDAFAEDEPDAKKRRRLEF